MRVLWSVVLLLMAKLATLAVPFTFKWATDALSGKGSAPIAGIELDAVGDRLAADHDRELWRLAHPDGGADAMARRHLCARGDACGAQARHHYLRAYARIVAALPSGAQDRRADARAGARPQRHRDHRADGDPAADADHRRGRAADGRAVLAIRLALCAGDAGDGRGLHVLHLLRDRVADRHPPQDERVGCRGEHQGDRLAIELRDRQIFRLGDGARLLDTTARWSATSRRA